MSARRLKDPLDGLSPEAMRRSIGLHLEAAQTASLQLRAQIEMMPCLSNKVDIELATIRVALKALATKINRRKK